MSKTQRAGVQQQPFRLFPVQRIAGDQMSDGRKVYAQLVGAAGNGFRLDPRGFDISFITAPVNIKSAQRYA